MLNTIVHLPTGVSLCIQGSDGRSAEDIQSALAKAHPLVTAHDQPVKCACRGDRDLLITIRRRRSTDGTVSFHLARFPHTGNDHVQCVFEEISPARSGRSAYGDGVVQETEDGSRISIGYDLIWGARAGEPIARPGAQGGGQGGGERLGRMTQLGLLHFLWDRAGLNLWKPAFAGKRWGWHVANMLQEAADGITIGGHNLGDHFLCLPSKPGERDRARLDRLLKTQATSWRSPLCRMLVIVGTADGVGERRLLCDSAYRLDLWLNVSPQLSAVLQVPGGISHQAIEAMKTRSAARRAFMAAKKHAAADGAHGSTATPHGGDNPEPEVQVRERRLSASPRGVFCAIGYLRSRNAKGHAGIDIVDAALMPVTAEWIPYESSYERQVAEMLVTEQRTFRKPLRYDAGVDAVFPDFELFDTPRPVLPMEVFGRTDEPYQARMAVKAAYYQREYGDGGWWQWIAAGAEREAEPPPFPPKLEQDARAAVGLQGRGAVRQAEVPS